MRENPGKKRARVERGAAGGFLTGLTDLIEKLNDLAETGRELRESGEIGDNKLKAVYGLRVRLGAGAARWGPNRSETSRSTARASARSSRKFASPWLT